MKQIVLRSGQPEVVELPRPSPAPGRVLVANAASVVSAGTERSAVGAATAMAGASLVTRALRNPDLVLKTLDHARKRGVRETVEVVRGAAGSDVPLGYSSAGIVLDTGGIAEFHAGQPVACAGAGYANHAEVVSVPGNLVVPVPKDVDLRDAAFATLGAIALQGVRRAEPALGERVVVVGLGLLGLLTVQLLRAAGCQVVGVEPQEPRRALALELGAERAFAPDEAVTRVQEWWDGVGADIAIVTAAGADDAIVNSSVQMIRHKGRVVPVGAVGLGLDRGPLYEREADLLISTSYGPGRYDPSYEEAGIDYPLSYVRWTENRNMGEFLRLIAAGSVRVEPLVELKAPIERATEAYAALTSGSPPLGAVITYDVPTRTTPSEVVRPAASGERPREDALRVAVVGAGSFIRSMHLPNLKADAGVDIRMVVARRGTAAGDVARSLGGAEAATDWRVAVDHPEVDLVVIGTRHDTHAEIAAAALRAGKAVFVEKPLGLTREEIDDVWSAGAENDRLAIGFNRPFSPLARQLEAEVHTVDGPIHLLYRVSAPLPGGHWLNDPRQGGGRILGEACHMLDFANRLCGTPLRIAAAALPARPRVESPESSTITVSYANGALATVVYSAEGSAAMPKERIDVLRGGRSWVLDDFTRLLSFDPDLQRVETQRKPDKGHAALLTAVLAACRGERSFEPGLEAAYVAQSMALAALESISSGNAIPVRLPEPHRADHPQTLRPAT